MRSFSKLASRWRKPRRRGPMIMLGGDAMLDAALWTRIAVLADHGPHVSLVPPSAPRPYRTAHTLHRLDVGYYCPTPASVKLAAHVSG
jgi:hypothetical protein